MTAVKVKAYLLRYTVLSNANFDRAYEIVRKKKKREREAGKQEVFYQSATTRCLFESCSISNIHVKSLLKDDVLWRVYVAAE